MPDWLKSALDHGEHLPTSDVIVVRVGIALIAGFVIAGIFRLTRGRHDDSAKSLPTTLVLLCVLISLVTVVIGNNLARAFGLVGALSIVRFRTVVKDTRDTAFVIFAVIVGMAIGAGYMLLVLIGVPAVTLAAMVMSVIDRGPSSTNGRRRLSLRMTADSDPEAILSPILDRFASARMLKEISTTQRGTTLELSFDLKLRQPESAFALVTQLARVASIDQVKLRNA